MAIRLQWRRTYKNGRHAGLPLRHTGASGGVRGIGANDLQQILITDYGPGAAIGSHKDRSVFGDVVGISLLSDRTFRLRRKIGARWQRCNLNVEPRSIYLLRGPLRSEWEHSIPAVDSLDTRSRFATFWIEDLSPWLSPRNLRNNFNPCSPPARSSVTATLSLELWNASRATRY